MCYSYLLLWYRETNILLRQQALEISLETRCGAELISRFALEVCCADDPCYPLSYNRGQIKVYVPCLFYSRSTAQSVPLEFSVLMQERLLNQHSTGFECNG